jgi:CDP-glucose 4,6-dehydratase
MSVIDTTFWQGRRVFITGHTGFKGSWLCLWLQAMGACVTGYALAADTTPSLFELSGLEKLVTSYIGDIRDVDSLRAAMLASRPEIVIHMAAQPSVRESYRNAADTYEINVMGTVRLFEAVRDTIAAGHPVKAVVHVSTDKCYDNKEWPWGYRETEPLGGGDPYSSSKACSELVVSAYRSSFFPPARYAEHGVAVASARAGKVIGGGDWAKDRLVPSVIAALLRGEAVRLRNPGAVHPWQHVLEPLGGYLLLAEKLVLLGPRYASAWNFGPGEGDAWSVADVVRYLSAGFGAADAYKADQADEADQPPEPRMLRLDCSKARAGLGWRPTWDIATALDKIVDWFQAYEKGADMRVFAIRQVRQYMRDSR